MDTDRIYADACVIIKHCVAADSRSTFGFFEYLKKHKIGSTTQEIRNIAENIVRKVSSKIHYSGSPGYTFKAAMKRLQVLDSLLMLETVPYDRTLENLNKVKEIFNGLFKEKGCSVPSLVPHYLQESVDDVYFGQLVKEGTRADKILLQPILEEDLNFIAAAATLHQTKYTEGDAYIASFDGHLVSETVSKAIKNGVGVTCDRPNEILRIIRKKDLSKQEPISDICM
jgi:hypothetical protein